MSVAFNHFISACVNPYVIGLSLMLLAWLLRFCRRRFWRVTALVLFPFALVWMWVWSTGALYRVMERSLEEDFPPVDINSLPEADAIVVLGGGMAFCTNSWAHAEMLEGSDRVWMGGKLWNAGKAPVVICSGGGVEFSTVPLLEDLGVERERIFLVDEAENTEQESRLIGELVRNRRIEWLGDEPQGEPAVLLVTSAWHMRRTMLLFKRSGLDVIPVPADHEFCARIMDEDAGKFGFYCPAAEYIYRNGYLFKEYLAYFLYRHIKGYK